MPRARGVWFAAPPLVMGGPILQPVKPPVTQVITFITRGFSVHKILKDFRNGSKDVEHDFGRLYQT